jgi:hypothetical protein
VNKLKIINYLKQQKSHIKNMAPTTNLIKVSYTAPPSVISGHLKSGYHTLQNLAKRFAAFILILFSACLLSFTAQAQQATGNSSSAYASVYPKPGDPSTPSSIDSGKTVQPAVLDTAWKPVRRLWGYTFGDFYYDAHADAANRGPETNYYNVPTYRNAFQFRRIYLGYDYDINRKFSAEILLSAEPAASTAVSGTTTISSSDNLADNKMAFFIKLADVRWKNVWTGSDFLVGESLTPLTVMLTEQIWGYRSVEKTIADFHRSNLYDVGASLQGKFDPATKNFGYDLMIGDNTQAALLSAANANTGFYKIFYGDVYAKLLNKRLIFDLYADYTKTAPATALIGAQSHNMVKGFAAWTTPKITFGVEAYTQQITNGVTASNGTTKVAENATVNAISLYSHGAIYQDKLGFFARYDGYNPDANFNDANVYTANTNLAAYNPNYKEHFVTAGFDYSPDKNVHFMPNLWLIQYVDQIAPGTTGYVPNNHTLVYRFTFF